jgi:hypothetical protein
MNFDPKGRLGIVVLALYAGCASDMSFNLNGIVARASYLQQQTDAAKNALKAWLEGVAYALSPKMKSSVLETITRRLKISDPALAMRGYEDLLHATDRKPFPSVEVCAMSSA